MKHTQQAADAHFRITCETWGQASAEIAREKTIVSSSKFLYLNCFFCEGSEVPLGMKVGTWADLELRHRFAGMFSQVDTVFRAFRAAAEKGACPIAMYHASVARSLELIFMASPQVRHSASHVICNMAFTPRGLGGWGFPHMQSWLTQETPDSLTEYTTIMTSILRLSNVRPPEARPHYTVLST